MIQTPSYWLAPDGIVLRLIKTYCSGSELHRSPTGNCRHTLWRRHLVGLNPSPGRHRRSDMDLGCTDLLEKAGDEQSQIHRMLIVYLLKEYRKSLQAERMKNLRLLSRWAAGRGGVGVLTSLCLIAGFSRETVWTDADEGTSVPCDACSSIIALIHLTVITCREEEGESGGQSSFLRSTADYNTYTVNQV